MLEMPRKVAVSKQMSWKFRVMTTQGAPRWGKMNVMHNLLNGKVCRLKKSFYGLK